MSFCVLTLGRKHSAISDICRPKSERGRISPSPQAHLTPRHTASANANAKSSCAPRDFPSNRSTINSRRSASHSRHLTLSTRNRRS